jgi:predicted O-linked N-acetylglucosamine transferase (SPINDLY family)
MGARDAATSAAGAAPLTDPKAAVESALQLRLRGEPEAALAELLALQASGVLQAGGPEAAALLAEILFELNRAAEAEPVLAAALADAPGDVRLLSGMGFTCAALERFEDAVRWFEQAAAADPGQAAVHNNLAIAYEQAGRTGDALAAFRLALAIDPAKAPLHARVGGTLLALGDFDGSLQAYVRALQLTPQDAAAYSDLLLVMNYNQQVPPPQLATAHRRYAEQIEAPLLFKRLNAATAPDPERPLRIGFVSSDLRNHPVGYFAEPLLAHLDRANFEAFAYCNFSVVDETSERMRALCRGWTTVKGLDDDALAARIRDDGIDILFDLNGHTGGTRLPVFARKPAPVQVTWLGYPNTTGLQAVDWRLVDATTDPPGVTDALCTERLWRLPECFICYRPAETAPAVAPGPNQASGRITFGTMNNLNKMSPLVAQMWARILQGVPDSTLLLKTRGRPDPVLEDAVLRRLEQHGLARARVRILNRADSIADHLVRYAEIDVALDTFPYGGTTTTCDALWMGVPVVTLAGNTHASRVGASLLSSVGLPDLVAANIVDYVERAVALAEDAARRAALRESLRPRMAASPLTDGPGFACRFEAACRGMWRQWCASR